MSEVNPGDSIVPIAVGVGIANTFTAWNAFAPSLSTVRRASATDSTVVGDLRHGEFAAVVVGGGVAAAASVLVGSALPLLVSGALLIALITLFEYTLYHKPFGTVEERS